MPMCRLLRLKDRLARLGQAVSNALDQKQARDLQRRAQAASRRADDELETRFRQVTAELSSANDALAAEIAERERAERALRERVQVLDLGADIGAALAQGTNLQAFLQQCTEALVRHLGAAFARIWIVEADEDFLVLKASAGIYTHLDGPHARVPVGTLKVGLIAREGRPHLTNDVPNDERVSDREWARREGMVGFAGYPLVVEGRVVGVMAAFARRPFSQVALQVLATASDGIAQCIERKRAEDALRNAHDEMERRIEKRTAELATANQALRVEIIERARSEQALRQGEERLRLALDAGLMGTWDWDILTDEIVWSDNMEAIQCLAPGSFDGTFEGFRRLIHPADRERVERAIARSIEERSGFEVEFRNTRHDGSTGWVSGKGRVFTDGEGQPARMIGVAMDITEQRRAEGEIFLLNAELEDRLERLHALREIDRAITGSIDLPVTLGFILDQVLGRLEIDAAAVLLCRPHQVSLEYVARKGYRGPAPTGSPQRLDEGPAGRAVLEGRTQHLGDQSGLPATLPRFARTEGFVTYWAVPLVAKGHVKGVLEVGHRSALAPEPDWLEFLEALAGQVAMAVDNAELFEGLRRSNLELFLAYDATIEGWSRAMDLRDKETEGHSQRVTETTLLLARSMGMSEAELVHARRGALLHDIGKMGIPDAILLKTGPLTDEEFGIIRRHPVYALEMLAPIAFLRPALDIPYCHHERWDGTGYPRGLKGEQISLAARIFAAVDIWDALRSARPYREAWPEERVREHIASLAGTHLDPDVVRAFLQHVRPPEPTASAIATSDGNHGRKQHATGVGRAAEATQGNGGI